MTWEQIVRTLRSLSAPAGQPFASQRAFGARAVQLVRLAHDRSNGGLRPALRRSAVPEGPQAQRQEA